MKNSQKGNIIIILLVIVVLIFVGWFFLQTKNGSIQNTQSETEEVSANSDTQTTPQSQKQVKDYQGRFYLISYPSNWILREVNKNEGWAELYPNNKSDEVIQGSFSMTDRVSVVFVNKPLTKKGDQEIVLSSGNSIYVNNKVGRIDRGTENAITYYVPISDQTYIEIISGESNKAIVDSIARSVVVQG